MDKKLNVKITYRNSRMEPVSTQLYPLRDYTDMMRSDLQKIISDVEDAIYSATGKQKDDWPDETWGAFTRIKHKLLDKAGDISRLPANQIEGGEDDGMG